MVLVVLIGTLSRSPQGHAAVHQALVAGHSHDSGSGNSGHDEAPEDCDDGCVLCLFAHGNWLAEAAPPVVATFHLGHRLNAPTLPPAPRLAGWFSPHQGRGPPARL